MKNMEIFGYVAISTKMLKIGKMFALGFKNPWHSSTTFVTGFAKTCIVHTSTFSTLKIHKICYACQTGMKLAGIVELLSLY